MVFAGLLYNFPGTQSVNILSLQ